MLFLPIGYNCLFGRPAFTRAGTLNATADRGSYKRVVA